jgi:hypothetical protein
MRRCFVAGAAAALTSVATARAQPPPQLIEYRTGHAFSLRRAVPLAPPGASVLLACNTRCMLGWCRFPPARAYAFGVYLDARSLAAAGALKRAGGGAREPGALVAALLGAAEGAARSALAGAPTPGGAPRLGCLSLVLVIARPIDGEHMARGFQAAVLARYTATLKQRGGEGEEGALAALGGLAGAFSGMSLAVGDEVVFAWDAGGDGVLRASVNGAPLAGGELRSAALARALFEVYAGEGGVSARAVVTLRANLAAACEEGADVEAIVAAEHATRTK